MSYKITFHTSLLSSNQIPINYLYFSNLCKTGCKVYNTKHSCPPHSTPFKTKENWCVVILQLQNNVISNNEYTKVRAINSILKSKLNKILSLYPNNQILGSGSCRLCKKCAYPGPCNHPDTTYPSMESVGIDVTSLCASLNHPLHWYMKGIHQKYEYGSVVGLIQTSNISLLNSQIRSIILPEKTIPTLQFFQ